MNLLARAPLKAVPGRHSLPELVFRLLNYSSTGLTPLQFGKQAQCK